MSTDAIARPPKIAKDGRTMSPASLANLKPPYKPGENGHGRVYPLKERLQHLLDKPYSELIEANKDKLKVGEVLALSSMLGAILREPGIFKEVWERLEGKVTENIDMRAVGVNILYELVKPKEDKDIT